MTPRWVKWPRAVIVSFNIVVASKSMRSMKPALAIVVSHAGLAALLLPERGALALR